jgi:SprT protein
MKRELYNVVQPIGDAQQAQVLVATEHFVCRAEAIFSRRFARIPVLFDLRGRTAGMFKVVGRHGLIRYNPWIFGKYFEENLRDTVPHEVAHYIVHEVYRRRTKPHGEQWKNLMKQFDADPGVTFQLDLDGVPQRRQSSHRYQCGCRIHEISGIRHKRVQRGTARYLCRFCNDDLVYAPQMAMPLPAIP